MKYQDLVLRFVAAPQGNDTFYLLIASSEAELFNPRPDNLSQAPQFVPPADVGEENRHPEPQTNRYRPPPLLSAGNTLWKALPGQVREVIAAGPREPANSILRIKINSRSHAIGDLPWETLNDGDGPPFALRPEYQIVRSVPVRASLPASMAEKPKAIIIASRPRLKADIGTKQIDWIRAALQKARFSVKFPTDGSVSSAADLLEETQPQVVHFVGHAAISIGDGCLVFESEDRRRTEWITADELANLLPPSVGLVCLSTPVSVPNYQIRGFPRLAQAAVATSLPTMVVNQFDHSDTIDELFWRTFYSALTTDNLNGDICQAVSTTWRVIANLDARPDGPQVPTSFNSPGASREWPAFSVFVRDGSGIPFRFFSPTPPLSPDKIAKAKALEIEAALRIRQANDLAERLPQFSPKAAAALRGEIELQINRANSMSEKLIQIGEE